MFKFLCLGSDNVRSSFYCVVLIDRSVVIVGILVVSAAVVTSKVVVGISVGNLVLGDIFDIVSAVRNVPVMSFVVLKYGIKGVIADHRTFASVT